jgi:SAM-dependent methyltransferase
MQARDIYDLRTAPGLRGVLGRGMSFVFLRVRPPEPYFKRDKQSDTYQDILQGTGRVLLLGSNQPSDVLARRGFPCAVQLDIEHHAHVDVVADAEVMSLVLGEGSFDYVVSTSMLEHTKHPWRVIAQTMAVLRPGGVSYTAAPWMYPLHGEPHDYFRFSEGGLRQLYEDAGFEVLETGTTVGGAGAGYQLTRAHLADLLSRGNTTRYHASFWLLTWLLWPLGLLERTKWMTSTVHVPSIVYIVGRKPVRP